MGNLQGGWKPPALPTCVQVVLSSYAGLFLVAMTYILWVFEHRSQVHFSDLQRSRGGGEGDWQPVRQSNVFHGVLAVVVAAVKC